MDPATAYRIVLRSIHDALRLLPIAEADYAEFNELLQASQVSDAESYFDFAEAAGTPLTPAMWAIYLLAVVENWRESILTAAVASERRKKYTTRGGDPAANKLLDAAAAALAVLSEITPASLADGNLSEEFMLCFYDFAKATEQVGNSDIAFNLMTIALDLGPRASARYEEVVRHGLALALAANRPHQIGACSSRLAAAVIAAADMDPRRRVEAFDCFESAFERLRLAPEDFREPIARVLLNASADRDYLAKFRPPLLSFLPPAEQPVPLIEALAGAAWPDRISDLPLEQWLDQGGASHNAQFWEMNIDLERLALAPKFSGASATTDWISWRIDHPAYRRAVPHNRSFLREADFDRLLLILSHEITHVLSLVGGIGNALNSLRVAAYDAELTMWTVVPGMTVESMPSRVAEFGTVALKEGHAANLLRAEQAIELSLKAQMLQDVWTPWFEGLAIFGEIAADPKLDTLRIGPVLEALRNLIDSQWNVLLQGQENEQVRKEFDQFAARFEARCSEAIERRGPSRLRAYLSTTDVPYLAGYIAVRSVVSAWRATTGRPLTGAEAFLLLLHATRFSTQDALPDLALRSDLFITAATERMCEWVCRLADLHPQNLDTFLTSPLEDDDKFVFTWENGQLIKRPRGPDIEPQTFAKDVERWLSQALASLTRPEDRERVENAGAETILLLEHGAQVLRDHFQTNSFANTLAAEVARVGHLSVLGTLLPIGSTAARFFVNMEPSRPDARLILQILTTEKHEEDHKPSINAMLIAIDRSSAERISASYRRLAIPRLELTRLIDLGGFATVDPHYAGVHMFAFYYDGWFDVRGPTAVPDIVIGKDPGNRNELVKIARARLYPEPLERAELEKLARGDRGAMRTREWINNSRSWSIGDVQVDVGEWANHVKALAERVLAAGARQPRQRQAARMLLVSLFAEQSLARDFVEMDFDSLTERVPERREQIITALFKTAQRPDSDTATATVAAALTSCGYAILAQGEHGWDVRAAHSLPP